MEIPPLFNLTEKVALVTGASRGIGAAIAQLLAEFGANVILTSRRAENLKEVEAVILSLAIRLPAWFATMVILHR